MYYPYFPPKAVPGKTRRLYFDKLFTQSPSPVPGVVAAGAVIVTVYGILSTL